MSLGMVAILLDVTVKVHHTHTSYPENGGTGERQPPTVQCQPLCPDPCAPLVQFDPSTSGVMVQEERWPVANLIPPPGTPINDSYNPLRVRGHRPGMVMSCDDCIPP
jgi:hypothetical protein